MPRTIRPGQSCRLHCDGCDTEFLVTLEPEAVGSRKVAAVLDPKDVKLCPFCGAGLTDADE